MRAGHLPLSLTLCENYCDGRGVDVERELAGKEDRIREVVRALFHGSSDTRDRTVRTYSVRNTGQVFCRLHARSIPIYRGPVWFAEARN